MYSRNAIILVLVGSLTMLLGCHSAESSSTSSGGGNPPVGSGHPAPISDQSNGNSPAALAGSIPDFAWAETEFSKSPYASLDTLKGINVVWLLTGVAKPTESTYDEDGKLPVVYKNKKAFREYHIWFAPAHNGPPYEINSSSSYKYFEEDKKTYIAESEGYSQTEDWSVDYYTRDNAMIKTDVIHIFFIDRCAYRQTARITSAGTLLVKQELNTASAAATCADLRMFLIYKKN